MFWVFSYTINVAIILKRLFRGMSSESLGLSWTYCTVRLCGTALTPIFSPKWATFPTHFFTKKVIFTSHFKTWLLHLNDIHNFQIWALNSFSDQNSLPIHTGMGCSENHFCENVPCLLKIFIIMGHTFRGSLVTLHLCAKKKPMQTSVWFFDLLPSTNLYE